METLPPPDAVRRLLVWHQGALGDLLLAAPALQALSRYYAGAEIAGVGHPERWGLLADTLPVASIWDGGEALWGWLYGGQAPVPQVLGDRLAGIPLAVVFSPRPQPGFWGRLRQAGVDRVVWIPSFPAPGDDGASYRVAVHQGPPDALQDGATCLAPGVGGNNHPPTVPPGVRHAISEPVALLQARHLSGLGFAYTPQPFRLAVDPELAGQFLTLPGSGPWGAVAPGSGHPLKNWPLSHYYEVTRSLAWQHGARVVWLAGPAEEAWLPYLQTIAAAQGHLLLSRLTLKQVASVLSACRLYLGGDSGLTHLAAAAGTRRVLALFGPTDERLWAPPGDNVRVVTNPEECRPCARGREIACPDPRCLNHLSPATVLEVAVRMLSSPPA